MLVKLTNITEERRLEIAVTVLHQLGGFRAEDLSESSRKAVEAAAAVITAALDNNDARPLRTPQFDLVHAALTGQPPAEQAPRAYPTEVDDLRQAVLAYNEMVRSAYSIAKRRGADTNWTAFANGLQAVINRHHATWMLATQPAPVSTEPANDFKFEPTWKHQDTDLPE